MGTVLTWHANATVFASLVQAGAVVLAGVADALVDVLLTEVPIKTHWALAMEGTI